MPDERPHVEKVTITNVEKRRTPSKHYVYIITVVWSDGKQQVICRRYCKFFDLQVSLIDTFPIESGAANPAQRILPFLPGKILFGRSQVKNVAVKRKELLTEYISQLITLPEKISRCELVLNFFEATSDDIDALVGETKKTKKEKTADNISDPVLLEQYTVIANFKKTDRTQISLAAGDTVDVIEKHENGWWFVSLEDEQGWAPSSFLESVDGTKEAVEESIYGMEENYICTKAFASKENDELKLAIGDVVIVLAKYSDGWWKVRLKRDEEKDHEGFVPVAHLKKVPKVAEVGIIRQKKPSPKNRGFQPPPRKGSVKRKDRGEQKTSQSPDEAIYVASNEIKKFADERKVNLQEGAAINVLEKSPNGWWLVEIDGEKGWIPSEMAQRKRRKKSIKNKMAKDNPVVASKKAEKAPDTEKAPKTGVVYVTLADYTSSNHQSLSFKKGTEVEILERDEGGWWFLRTIYGEDGWAPSNFIGEKKQKQLSNTAQDIDEMIPIAPMSITEDEAPPVIPERRTSLKSVPLPARPPIIKPNPLPKINSVERSSSPSGKPARRIPEPKSQVSELTKEFQVKLRKVSKPSDFANKEENTAENGLKKVSKPSYFSADKEIKASVAEKKSSVPARPPLPNTCKSDAAPSKERPSIGKPQGEMYVALGTYSDSDEGMLSIVEGQRVYVLSKDDSGWWVAKAGDQTGWVPSNFLQKQ